MSEITIADGKAHCEECGKGVSVKEQKKIENIPIATAAMAWVLVGDCGHVIGERSATDEVWEKYIL